MYCLKFAIAKAERMDVCDRCGKTANCFNSEKIFEIHLKDNKFYIIMRKSLIRKIIYINVMNVRSLSRISII